MLLSLSALAGCGKQSYNFAEEQYSYMLLSDLVSYDGSLSINKDYASFTDNDGVEKKYYPTEIKEEEISYEKILVPGDEEHDPITRTIKEKVVVLYYGSARNDGNYRIIFSANERKFVEFQQSTSDGWKIVHSFVPKAPEFAGAYNGFGYYDDKNYVYIIGNELVRKQFLVKKSETETKVVNAIGYEVANYYAYDGAFGRDNFLLVPAFYLAQNILGVNVYKGADMLDYSDGEFFDANWYAPSDSPDLKYFTGTGISKTAAMHADASMFLSELVDEDGNRHQNSYTLDDSYALSSTKVDGELAEYVAKRTENGLVYEFTTNNDESNVKKYSVTILPGKYEFTVGGVTKKFASMNTWYDESNLPCVDFGEDPKKYIAGNLSYSFSMYYASFDWDAWEATDLTYAWNDQKISDYKLAADSEGRAVLSFKESDNSNVSIRRANNNIAIVNRGNESSYAYSVDELRRVFSTTFVNPAHDVQITVNDDLEVIVGNAEPIKANFEYLPTFGIVLKYGDNYIIPYAYRRDDKTKADDYYGYVLSSGNEQIYLLTENELSKYEGSYTNDGTHTVSFADGAFKVNGSEASYDFTFLTNVQTGDHVFVFEVTIDGGAYYAMPSDGAIILYNSKFERVAYYIDSSIFDSLVGNYVYLGEYGREYIRFHDDGSLTMDCENATHDGLVRDVNATYTIGASEKGVTVTATITLPSGQTGAVPMNKNEGALVIGDLAYLEESLYDLQGVYGDGSSNAIMVYQNHVYVNIPSREGNFTSKQTIKTIRSTSIEGGRKDVITTEEYVIEATHTSGALSALSFYKISEGESSRVNLLVDSNDAMLTSNFHLKEETAVVTTYDAKLTNSISEGKIKVEILYKYNDIKQTAPTTINGVCYYNGHLSIKINHALTALYLYMDGDTPVMEKGQGGAPLPPPPVPSL